MFGDIYSRLSARGRMQAGPRGASQGTADLSGQPPQPAAAPQAPVDPAMERLARQRGFPNYATMMAFERNRQQARGPGSQNYLGTEVGPEEVQAAQSWTPRALLEYVSDRYRRATSR